MNVLVNIFDFKDNFREYLKKYYDEQKKENPKCSYQWIAEKAELDRSYLFDVINKQKNLPRAKALRLSKALEHGSHEEGYFINLVGYSQADDEVERDNYKKEMLRFVPVSSVEAEQLRRDQSVYLSTWLHSAVRGVIDYMPCRDEYDMIARLISQPTQAVTSDEVKSSIELLERLNIIDKDEDAIYRLTQKNIAAGKELLDSDLRRFHREFLKLGRDALFHRPPGSCRAKSLTLPMSKLTYEYIWEETQKFVKRIIEVVSNASDADQLFQYQFLSFPLTNSESVDEDKKSSG